MEKLNNSEKDLWVVCGIGYACTYLKEFLMSKKEIEIKGNSWKEDFFFLYIFDIYILLLLQKYEEYKMFP